MSLRRWRSLVACLVGVVLTTTSVAEAGSPRGGPMTVGVREVAAGLTAPVALLPVPDSSGRLFVVDQVGLIRILAADGTLVDEPFLDLGDRMVNLSPSFDERGLLGLAFHPRYADNGRFFVYYSAPRRPDADPGYDHTSHVSEFVVSNDDPDRADPDSEQIVLQVDQPQANHNAGALAFGPADGYLYIALGDGGGAGDTGPGHTPDLGNAQDPTNLLGSILRIDIDSAAPYAIPADNPFVGTAGRDEIYAYGFRNPYRISFDTAGGDRLFAADVGQGLWEEVNVVHAGANHGWNIREGTHCFDPERPLEPPADCPDVGPFFGDALVDPVIEYPHRNQPHGIGVAVIGGHVHRGHNLPQLQDRYVFGDWSTSFTQPDGTLLAARERARGLWQIHELRVHGTRHGRLGSYVLGFGHAPDGTLYVLTSQQAGPTGDTGRVLQLTRPGR